MKRYPVLITPNAAEDIRAAYSWLAHENPGAAKEWLAGLRQDIQALSNMPQAHALAQESATFDEDIRLALSGRSRNWKIYFTLRENAVYVLHIRHGSRQPWYPDDVSSNHV